MYNLFEAHKLNQRENNSKQKGICFLIIFYNENEKNLQKLEVNFLSISKTRTHLSTQQHNDNFQNQYWEKQQQQRQKYSWLILVRHHMAKFQLCFSAIICRKIS